MKNIKIFFQLLLCLFISLSAFSQEKKDSISKKERKYYAGTFVSVGLNTTQYSDAFTKYLFDKAGSSEPVQIDYLNCGNNGYVYKLEGGSTIPHKFDHNKLSYSPIANLGMEFIQGGKKKITLHHVIETGYMKSHGEYSYTVIYGEGYHDGPAMGGATIRDTVQAEYSQTVLTLGYKFQPAFKSIFLSVGINASLNLLKVAQEKKEQIECSSEFEQSSYQHEIHNSVNNTTNNYQFVNIPLQFGAGYNLKLKRIVLKPAFYYSPNIRKNYNSYIISLAVLYK